MKINNITFYNPLINFGARNKKPKKTSSNNTRCCQKEVISKSTAQAIINSAKINHNNNPKTIKDENGKLLFSKEAVKKLSTMDARARHCAIILAQIKNNGTRVFDNEKTLLFLAKAKKEVIDNAILLAQTQDENGQALFKNQNAILLIAQGKKDACDRAFYLKNLKDKNKKPLLDDEDIIANIALIEDKEAFDCAINLALLKDENGNKIFTKGDIISQIAQLKDNEIINNAIYLAQAKDKSGNNLFEENETIIKIAKSGKQGCKNAIRFINAIGERACDLLNKSYYMLKTLELDDDDFTKAINLIKDYANITYGTKAIFVLSQTDNPQDVHSKIEQQKEKMYNNPKLYINGEFEKSQAKEIIDEQLKETIELILLSAILDKETLDTFFRMRFDTVDEYIETIKNYTPEDFSLLNKLIKSHNTQGKPFTPIQKIQFIDLIYEYKNCNLDFSKMKNMISENKVDIEELNFDLLNKLMKLSGLTNKEIALIPKEKLNAWDIKYIHLLAKEINEAGNSSFKDIIRATSLDDFYSYIHNKSNKYGKANAKTKEDFYKIGIDYEKWIHPRKENEIHFVSENKNEKQLRQIILQIEEDMTCLLKTPAKKLIQKQFPNFIKDDKFIIPNEYQTSKTKLEDLLKILTDTSKDGQLSQIWQRALNNSSSNDTTIANKAKNTLTILSHLIQRIDDLSKIKNKQTSKTLDLTIKMWDRLPQKDLFQGNYSTCCIGIGHENGSIMPHYLMNCAFNMIELIDNTNGKTIGNALCYFAEDKNNNPIFIIDNIEINNRIKLSQITSIKLRNSIIDYAKNIIKETTNRVDIPIYISKKFNDIYCSDLPSKEKTISFVGEIDCNEVYMDLFGGWIRKNNLAKKVNMFEMQIK